MISLGESDTALIVTSNQILTIFDTLIKLFYSFHTHMVNVWDLFHGYLVLRAKLQATNAKISSAEVEC